MRLERLFGNNLAMQAEKFSKRLFKLKEPHEAYRSFQLHEDIKIAFIVLLASDIRSEYPDLFKAVLLPELVLMLLNDFLYLFEVFHLDASLKLYSLLYS